MMTRVTPYLGLLTAIGLIGAPADLRAEEAEKPAPVEHHIYLHVMPPKDGEPLQVFVAPPQEREKAPETEPAPVPVDEVPVPAPEEEMEEDALIEDVPIEAEPEVEEEEAVLDEVAVPMLEEKAEEPALLPPPLVPPTAGESLVLDDAERGAPMGLLLFIFVLAIFLGFELISKVPSQLHTPLMSGSNAISGITIVGALAAAGLGVGGAFGTFLGTLAVAFATINVVGGYMVTNRMLAMFKKKDGGQK